MYQVKFKYSLIEDIKVAIEIYSKRKWLKENEIIIFKPSILRFFKIIFTVPKISFESDIPVICYWVSNGSWGSYEYPDKIMIMPFDLPEDMSLKELIKHEITHLKHPESEKMEHTEKEKYIEGFEK